MQMMKKILKVACSTLLMTVIAAGMASPALAETKIPERPEGYVRDMAGVLSDSEKAVLNEQLEAYNQKGKSRIDVLTVKSTDGESIRSLAGRVEAAWRTGVIGTDMEPDAVIVASTDDEKITVAFNEGMKKSVSSKELSGITGLLPSVLSPRELKVSSHREASRKRQRRRRKRRATLQRRIRK